MVSQARLAPGQFFPNKVVMKCFNYLTQEAAKKFYILGLFFLSGVCVPCREALITLLHYCFFNEKDLSGIRNIEKKISEIVFFRQEF